MTNHTFREFGDAGVAKWFYSVEVSGMADGNEEVYSFEANMNNYNVIGEKITNENTLCINPIQTGLFLLPRTGGWAGGGGGGGLRRPYPCNSTTTHGIAPKFTQNDIIIISII